MSILDMVQEIVEAQRQGYNLGFKSGQAFEHKRIQTLLAEELCDEPDCAATYEHAHCQVVQALINRIEGKS